MYVLGDPAGERAAIVGVNKVEDVASDPHVPREAQVLRQRVACLPDLPVDERDRDTESTFIKTFRLFRLRRVLLDWRLSVQVNKLFLLERLRLAWQPSCCAGLLPLEMRCFSLCLL